MALYEFRCKNEKCNHEFEARIPIKEVDIVAPDVMCPQCNSPTERLISKQRAQHSTWKNWRL